MAATLWTSSSPLERPVVTRPGRPVLPMFRPGLRLLSLMVAAVAVLAVLAYWDAEREVAAELDDFADEQALLAQHLAAGLSARLMTMRRDANLAADATKRGRPVPASLLESYVGFTVRAAGQPASGEPATSERVVRLTAHTAEGAEVDMAVSSAQLLAGLAVAERPGTSLVMVRAPGEVVFQTVDGRVQRSDELAQAIDRGEPSRRVERPEAAALGLPRRLALAGLASVEAGSMGHWGVAVVTSAWRLRDRESRAHWRLVLSVAAAAGLVALFGGLALRKERDEARLQQELARSDERQRQGERLERATKAAMIGTFASGIAHEVSTPLAVIVGRAEQLTSRLASDERGAKAVRAILEQAENIHQVVRGFLSLAHGRTVSFRPESPAAIARGAMGLVEHRFTPAGVMLTVRVDDDLPMLRCHARLLEHALINLLLNACDACSPGGHVELSAAIDGTSLVFAVTDDGVGIDAANAARVTEPFFTTKPAGQGSGVGLAVTSEIVKIHRGQLALAPARGGGTRATITLRLDGAEDSHGEA